MVNLLFLYQAAEGNANLVEHSQGIALEVEAATYPQSMTGTSPLFKCAFMCTAEPILLCTIGHGFPAQDAKKPRKNLHNCRQFIIFAH